MRTTIIAMAAALLLSGCTTDAVTMKNPQTGAVAKCGPFWRGGINGPIAAAEQERQCVSDFQRQGFHRVSQ